MAEIIEIASKPAMCLGRLARHLLRRCTSSAMSGGQRKGRCAAGSVLAIAGQQDLLRQKRTISHKSQWKYENSYSPFLSFLKAFGAVFGPSYSELLDTSAQMIVPKISTNGLWTKRVIKQDMPSTKPNALQFEATS